LQKEENETETNYHNFILFANPCFMKTVVFHQTTTLN